MPCFLINRQEQHFKLSIEENDALLKREVGALSRNNITNI